jgi:lysyl-tRNA synthetase, class II
MLRVESHLHGPRVYVLGRRIHEWHLGIAVLVVVCVTALRWPEAVAGAGVGVWLVVKDWRDVRPATRDTSAWRLGVHRRATSLRVARRLDGLPTLAAGIALATGLMNLVSTLTPNVAWRGRLLLRLEPVESIPVFHTLALPASVALIVAALYLGQRRRRAWQIATLLLVVLGALNLLKGLDFEEALLSWAGAAFLWSGRDAFWVRHDRVGLRSSLWQLLCVAATGAVGVALAVWLSQPTRPDDEVVMRETGDLLLWQHGPLTLGSELAWLPVGAGLLGVATFLVVAYHVFRPAAPPAGPACGEERRTARSLVRAHGRDTLAFFKLRGDLRYVFAPDGRAFLGYRVQRGVLLVAGDPVGPDDAMPGLLRETFSLAERHGLRVAALGAGERLLPLYREAGLRSLYVGDEAILDTPAFSLDGRPIRKVRQSVTRLEKAGYEATVEDLGSLGAATRAELERVSSCWLAGSPERGFSMAMDSLGGEHQGSSAVVIARDADGVVRGFLHFVPSYGRPAMSLSCMRRDRATPNGLTEFLVVRAIELLRERGVEELSLNFAAFARALYGPTGVGDRLLRGLISIANPFFQIESLYRFNAKFFPRWEPRYLVYDGLVGLPRIALAALVAEGQLAVPRFGAPARA